MKHLLLMSCKLVWFIASLVMATTANADIDPWADPEDALLVEAITEAWMTRAAYLSPLVSRWQIDQRNRSPEFATPTEFEKSFATTQEVEVRMDAGAIRLDGSARPMLPDVDLVSLPGGLKAISQLRYFEVVESRFRLEDEFPGSRPFRAAADEQRQVHLWPADESSFAVASIAPTDSAANLSELVSVFEGIRLALAPAQMIRLANANARIRVLSGFPTVRGKECLALEVAQEDRRQEHRLWIDPSRGYVVVRCQLRDGPYLRRQCDIDYVEENGIWLPFRVIALQTGTTGDCPFELTARVASLDRGVSSGDDLQFPLLRARTLVNDLCSQEIYFLREDGTRRRITREEILSGVDEEALTGHLSLSTRIAAAVRSHGVPFLRAIISWPWVLCSLFVLLAVGNWIGSLKRRARGPSRSDSDGLAPASSAVPGFASPVPRGSKVDPQRGGGHVIQSILRRKSTVVIALVLCLAAILRDVRFGHGPGDEILHGLMDRWDRAEFIQDKQEANPLWAEFKGDALHWLRAAHLEVIADRQAAWGLFPWKSRKQLQADSARVNAAITQFERLVRSPSLHWKQDSERFLAEARTARDVIRGDRNSKELLPDSAWTIWRRLRQISPATAGILLFDVLLVVGMGILLRRRWSAGRGQQEVHGQTGGPP